MRPETVVAVVTRLYIAAGRQPPEQVDFEVWAEAIDDIDDITALNTAKRLVRDDEMEDGPTTPAAFRGACGSGRRMTAWGEIGTTEAEYRAEKARPAWL